MEVHLWLDKLLPHISGRGWLADTIPAMPVAVGEADAVSQ